MNKVPYHKKGKRFTNPHVDDIRRSMLDVVLWKTGVYQDPIGWEKAPADFKYPEPENQLFNPKEPIVHWVNHNTFLLVVDDIHILTDPIWSHRCSPLDFFGPKRRHDPSLEIENLPRVDYVVISHNHYDHLDRDSVKKLQQNFPDITWIVPLGVKKWFKKLGIHNVYERAWWEEIVLESPKHPEVKIKATAVPTQHFSGRHCLNLNKTLWVGWVLEFARRDKEFKRMYYVGDTGYNPHDFKMIGEHFGHMDLSLIPIGTYVPRVFMSPVHIEPANAVKIHTEVNSKLSVSMHWKTFNLSDEPLNQPPYDLYLSCERGGVDPRTFRVIEPGNEINW